MKERVAKIYERLLDLQIQGTRSGKDYSFAEEYAKAGLPLSISCERQVAETGESGKGSAV